MADRKRYSAPYGSFACAPMEKKPDAADGGSPTPGGYDFIGWKADTNGKTYSADNVP